MTEELMELARKASFENEGLVKKSNQCGCYFCWCVYKAEEVVEWIDDENGRTARCPYCGVDAVIPDASGVKLDKELLKAMYEKWFN